MVAGSGMPACGDRQKDLCRDASDATRYFLTAPDPDEPDTCLSQIFPCKKNRKIICKSLRIPSKYPIREMGQLGRWVFSGVHTAHLTTFECIRESTMRHHGIR
jgi:hypothetical protein